MTCVAKDATNTNQHEVRRFLGKVMKVFVFVILIVNFLLGSSIVFASKCENCTVTAVQPDPRRGGTYIWFDGTWTLGEVCLSTRSSKAFWVGDNGSASNIDNVVISAALTAMTAGLNIKHVYGNGQCSDHQYEDLNYFQIEKK